MKNTKICRCCLMDGCCKNLANNYIYVDKLENYGEMLTKTFNITLTFTEKYICEECITKLRDAAMFRQQIFDVEQTFTERINDHNQAEFLISKSETNQSEEIKKDEDEENALRTWDDDQYEDDVFDIKIEPNEESSVNIENEIPSCGSIIKFVTAAALNVVSETTCPEKMDKNKTIKSKTTAELKYTVNELKNTSNKPTDAQKDLCENTFKLISNSNMCLFKSLKTRFACYVCKETFFEIKVLREHSKIHDKDTIWHRVKKLQGMTFLNTDITNLTCELCAENCKDIDILKKHLTEKHDFVFGNSANHLLVPFKLEVDFKCIICKLTFNTFSSLSTHMNSHATSNVCEICGTFFYNRNSLRLHLQAMHKERKCPNCQQTFQTSSKLAQHLIKTHNKATGKRYCRKCDMTFQYTYRLENHMIEKHGAKKKTTECSFCGKSLKNSLYLKIHIRSVHLKERNHPCSLCDLRFFTSTDRTRHERTHQDSSIFTCSICDAKFKSKDSLRRHMKRQH